MTRCAVIFLAGSGVRMQGLVADKALAVVGGKPLFVHSMDRFLESGVIDFFALVYRDLAQREMIEDCLKDFFKGTLPVRFIQGGKERSDSVWNALSGLSESTKIVYLHDAARPLITESNLKNLQKAVKVHKAAVLAHPAVDTTVYVDEQKQNVQGGMNAYKLKPLDRSHLWCLETPQVFDFDLIASSYKRAQKSKAIFTDDVGVAMAAGHAVAIVNNPGPNPKVTLKHDLAYVDFLMQQKR